MANNDENTDSGSPSLSEEENNVSDKKTFDRPNLVVDLNIPLQQDRSESGEEGVVNYGFEFGENRRNDCAENFNDSKSLAKDKYVNESTNHRYSATLLGKVLNTSCDTEITIPDDPNINCNKSKTRAGNTDSNKNKESHVPEKIPLEELQSTVVPIISDNYEKALEAQKEYSATQNGGKDINHDISGVNTDKLNQQNNGKRFEEYFMPANTHKKLLRGEKLYLTKEKEVATCSGWKLAVLCGSLLLVVVGVLLGVLAGVGVLVKESSIVAKGSSLPDSASMSAEAKHSNELPLSSLPITVSPNHPSLQTVPKVLIVELTLANESFSDELLNDSSKEYIVLNLQVRKMLASSFKNLEMNFTSMEILNSRLGNIIARFIIKLKGSEISEINATETLEKYIRRRNNMISSYQVKKTSVWIADNFNTCLVNKGSCSHDCHWNEKNYSQTCLCPNNFILSDDSKTCMKKYLGNSKRNGVSTDKTTLTPKMMTEVPTTHSSILLVTEVATTMPKLGPSTWISVPEPTRSYDVSTLKSSESLSTNSHNDVFSTEQSVTPYNSDPHEMNTYETTFSENQILELTTGSAVDDTSDLATVTSRTEEKNGWNDTNIIVTTTHKDWPMIINLTDSMEITNIYNSDSNTSNTLATVTNSHFNQSIMSHTTEIDFSNATDDRMLLMVTNATDIEELATSSYRITENNTVAGTDEIESVTYENDILNSTVSTVMFNNSFDYNTENNNKAIDTVITRMEEETTTFNETIGEILSTNSSESYVTFDNVSSVTEIEYTTISALADSSVTSITDTNSQTTLTSLLLNVTNSANLNNDPSPLYVVSTESTATEQNFAQNVTKEQTFVELSLHIENSSETILHVTENTEETVTSQILSTVKPNINYDSNDNMTDYPDATISMINEAMHLTTANVTNETMHLTTANVPEEYTNKTINNDFIDIDFQQNLSKNISTIAVSTSFDTDVPNSTLPSEEVIPKRTTRVDNNGYFNTATNHLYPVTSTEKDTVYYTSDETVTGNDYSTTNDFITDMQNTSDTSYISSITEDSRDFLSSSVTDTIALSKMSTTENVQTLTAQTKRTLHETENANISDSDPPISHISEHPFQGDNFYVSSMVAGIDEITDCDNCTSDIISTVEQTPALPTASINDSEYTFNANNVTLTSNIFNFTDSIMFPTNASIELVHSNSSQIMDSTTVTELTNSNTGDVEINDSNTVTNNSSVDSIRNNTSVEIEHTSIVGNISSDSYNDNNEMEVKVNFSDISGSQLNETSILTLMLGNTENGTEIIGVNVYVPNENRSLKDNNISSEVLNNSDFEMITKDTNYENQTDAMNMTSTSVESGEIAMNETVHSNCSEGKFPCSDGNICLDLILQCDGIINCPDISDENQCEEDCRLNFRCANTSLCVSAYARCDDIWDCEDGSDEVGCEPTSCGIKEVMCSDGSACIKPADICNEAYNCHDKSDEVGCVERTTCDTNRFFCPEGLCIPLAQLCDAVQDCKNGEDEANCSCTGSDVFQCSNSICLTKDVFCDGKMDCQDGSDERGCVQVDVFGVVQVYDYRNQTWKLLCGENWSESDGNYICQELGFSSALEVGTVPVFAKVDWMERNSYTTSNSTLWTLGIQPVDSCSEDIAATVKCEEYACGGTQNQYRRKRIAGGQESGHLPGQWTSLAMLYSTKSNRTCHGEVISPVWVLTSSQCLISHLMDFSDLQVRAGIINSNELVNSTQERKAQEVIIHPHSSIHRSPALRDYDVALIRIAEPFELNRYVNAICLGEEEIQEGITCFTGSFQNQQSSEELRSTLSLNHLAVSVTDRNSCNSTEHYSKSITTRMICGQTTGSTSLCNNDDGVPLMCLSTQRKYHVAGMLSYQHNCGIYYKQPAVFSNINDMRPFIEMIVGKYRYNTSYDSSLYVIMEMTESSTDGETNSTTDFNATTILETELLGSTDSSFDMESTGGITLAQINNFTYETTSTSLPGEDFMHVTTKVITQTYLSNETNFNQNTTSDILENGNNTTLLKLVSNAEEMQEYRVTPAETDEPENINNSSLVTTVAVKEFELLTEVHSTVPSIEVVNDTEDYSGIKERKALDYELANVDRTVLVPVNSTEFGQSHKVVSMSLVPDNVTDHNMNTSSLFKTSLIENSTWHVDSVIDKPETDSYLVNPVTEVPIFEQHPVPQSQTDSVHSANFSQSNILLTVDLNEHSLKKEYASNVNNPVVTENPIGITTLIVNTEVKEENMQNTYESTTLYINDSNPDIFEGLVEINKTESSTDYSNSTFSANTKDFDIPVTSSNNYSTYINISSQQNFVLSPQILTYPPVVSDLPNTSNTANETLETESDFSSTQEILINATTTNTMLIDEESLTIVHDQETSVSNEGFNNSTHFPNIPEINEAYELNKTVTSEPAVPENYSTHLGSECGIKDLENANSTWPYIGILKGNETCLASIISPKWVITSYHCLLSGASSNTTTWTFLRGYFHSAVKNIVIHPQFEILGIDMALVELENNGLEGNSSICLPKYKMTSQHHCETAVGNENIEGEYTITYIPVSTEPVMNCDISYNQLSVQHICINNVSQICQENGIPLMCINDDGQWQLQGISSIKTCEDNSTSIYFDIESLVPWIEDSIISEAKQ